jgi:signal transduction histidine kinase
VVISLQDEVGDVPIWRSAGLEGLWRRARFAPEAEAARQAALEDGERRLFRLQHPELEAEHLMGLCLPLRSKERVFGVLEAYGQESLLESATVDTLSSLASQAGSALENALLYEELEEREQMLQDLVAKLLRAQEEEHRRVAYEIHDGLAQVAAAAHQHLQAFAERFSPDAEKGRRDLDRILRLVRATVTDARRVIANLRPTSLDDLGLAAALSLEVESLREEGYHVDYEENLGDGRLPAAAEISLFRVAQEALNNVRKHAQTRQVSVELRRRDDEVLLKVLDHGRGFDPAAPSIESGPGARVGLAGMRERINMLGGSLKIRSQPGAGTSVVATIDVTQVPQVPLA